MRKAIFVSFVVMLLVASCGPSLPADARRELERQLEMEGFTEYQIGRVFEATNLTGFEALAETGLCIDFKQPLEKQDSWGNISRREYAMTWRYPNLPWVVITGSDKAMEWGSWHNYCR